MKHVWLKVICALTLVLVSTPVLLAGNGKITGAVKDSASGEPIVATNIVVEGTTFGAAADVEGIYFILNVPPGIYSVRASAVGYVPVTVRNIRVSSDQIVTMDFSLRSQAIGLEEVVIEAERRIVDPSLTSSKTTIASDELRLLPIREIYEVVATSASVYKGFIRGGRQYETKTIVDGIDVTDQFYAASADQTVTPYLTYNGITRQKEASKSSMIDMTVASVEEASVLTGGVGADYSTATAGLISYSLREGRGSLTGGIRFRTSSGGLSHFGPDVYNDGVRYLGEKFSLLASGVQANIEKANRYTWTPGKYSYGKRPTYDFEASLGGNLTDDLGLYITAGLYDSYGRFPSEKFKRVNGSLKATYNVTSDIKVNAVGILEDRGRLFGWRNRNYVEDFRFFLEGAPQYDGVNFIGSLKLTHVLSPRTFYEIQASILTDQTRRGYVDGNNDGIIELEEDGDFLTFSDTAQVNRYMANASGSQFNKFFTPTPRNETGSETSYIAPGRGPWKIARPGIFYEDFTNANITLKGDITSQYTLNHQLRAGVQVKLHDLDRELRAGYIGGVFSTYKNYVEEVWNVKPKEISAYLQDKMEYAGLIINLGARLDAIDYDAGDYANFFAPFDDTTDASGGPVRVPVRSDKIPMKLYFSPRVGVSHPISDDAAMYFSFSRQTQPQPFSRLFTNYNDFGNPSLPVVVRVDQDPIRTTNYDVGVQWSFLPGYGLDVSAYYRDIENYSSIQLVVTPRAPWRGYNLSTNFGYADSRGVEISLRKNIASISDFLRVGGRLTYTYSYIKQAVYTGGNITSFSTAAGDSAKYTGIPPFGDLNHFNTIEQNVRGGNSILTGGYDRPHRIVYTLSLQFPYEITVSSKGRFESGFYYPRTLADPRSRELGEGPWTKQVDFRIEKMFALGPVQGSAYIDILNAFDVENILAYDNSVDGQTEWERNGNPTGPTLDRAGNPTARPVTQDGSPIFDISREVYFGITVTF